MSTNRSAHRAGLAAPDAARKDETHGFEAVGFTRMGIADEVNCPGVASDMQPDKIFATLRARLALAGYVLARKDDRDGPLAYIVMRWNMVRELPDLTAVDAFAVRVGVRA